MRCKLCEKEIDWSSTLPPLSDVLFDWGIQKRYCPKCWDRIWTEWYEYNEDGFMTPYIFEKPSDAYIISKYKGNTLVGKIPGKSYTELCAEKKKHWWQK